MPKESSAFMKRTRRSRIRGPRSVGRVIAPTDRFWRLRTLRLVQVHMQLHRVKPRSNTWRPKLVSIRVLPRIIADQEAELEALLRAQTLYPQPTFTQPMINAMATPTSSFKTPSSPTGTKQPGAEFQPSQSHIPHPINWEWGPKVTMKFDAPLYVERDFDGRPIKPVKSLSTPAPSAPWASTSTIPAPYTPPQAASFESSPGEINLTDVLPPGVPLDASVGPNPTPLMQVFYHGYPSNLPSPQLLEHVVHTFFDRVPTISRLFHRATFLARLSLPPTHSNFPAAGTLHAICAVSARYTAAVRTLPVDELVARTGDMPNGKRDSMTPLYRSALNDDFGERHAAFAKEELYGIGGAGGHAIFECCRAAVSVQSYREQT
jgi:hypothetical protein